MQVSVDGQWVDYQGGASPHCASAQTTKNGVHLSAGGRGGFMLLEPDAAILLGQGLILAGQKQKQTPKEPE